MAFIRFMESTSGRVLRVVAGIVLVVTGLVLGGGWLVLSAVGLVPLAAGAFGVCLFAPLFHQPFRRTSA
ncbi:MAG TPA: DUF2892 domain-containing protein [Acidimicrobiales bacterium]|nr:DUF2892 domain-containing protein [Acidimicrobiales bacterium]